MLPRGALTLGVSDFSPGKLAKHFKKYAVDALEWGEGNITIDSYLKRAQSLLGAPVGENILGLRTKNGFLLEYNTRTDEIATMKPGGIIETLFRPKTGLDYWFEQEALYGKDAP